MVAFNWEGKSKTAVELFENTDDLEVLTQFVWSWFRDLYI